MLATEADYYVIEAQVEKPWKDPMPADCDERLGEYLHYVTHDCKKLILNKCFPSGVSFLR